MSIKEDAQGILIGVGLGIMVLMVVGQFLFLPFIGPSFTLGLLAVGTFMFVGINSKKLGFVNIAFLFLLGLSSLTWSYIFLVFYCDLDTIETVRAYILSGTVE